MNSACTKKKKSMITTENVFVDKSTVIAKHKN